MQIVGPHSTKLPQSWDTGSDQPSVPASFDVFLFHSIWQGAKPRTPTLRNTFPLTFPDRLPYLGIPGDDYLNVLMIFLFKHAVCVCVCPVHLLIILYKPIVQVSLTFSYNLLWCIQRKVICRSWAHASMPSRFVSLSLSSLSICLQPTSITYLHLLYSSLLYLQFYIIVSNYHNYQ